MQPNNRYNLDEILTDDPLGILDYKKRDAVKNNDQRLVDSFHEINDFFESEEREPEKVTDIKERDLYSRLKGVRENPDKISFLKKYDKYNLLENVENLITVDSVDDIFNNDPLGILSGSDVDIHTLKNVPEIKKDRADADFVARREVCEDFEKYETLFRSVQDDLKNNQKKLKKFEHGDIRKGSMFVDKGILVFIRSVQMEDEKDSFGKDDGRLICIFENGTQSNVKYRSLQKSLEIDGQTIIENDSVVTIAEDDINTGYIYILKSLSNDDRIMTMKNLYKIGFSSGDVKDRIKNAEKDPTYLMAPVAMVTSFRVVNMNPHKLEQLLHKFFGSSRLEIDIVGLEGDIHSPREWFIAPLDVIETAIEMIVSGNIINYRYSPEKEVIEMIGRD